MNQNKIIHLAESVDFESGGLRTAVLNLHNFLLKNPERIHSEIYCNKKEELDDYQQFMVSSFKSWSYSKALIKFLNNFSATNSIFHIHGLFLHIHYAASKKARRGNIPYLVTPHGMLEPWHLNDKKIKKLTYLNLVGYNLMKNAKVLHAITPLEKENLYKLCKHNNIVEIPNLIYYNEIPKEYKYQPKVEYLLFLGRLHPKKGLDLLIDAMSKISNKNIVLKIVGTENDYSKKIKEDCEKSNLSKRIQFIGSVYGQQKYELFANAKAFVAPSFSEAIGIVNLEAAICKTPVITTFNTGIKPEWHKSGGIMINPILEELTHAINEVTAWSDLERNDRGKQLHDFVVDNYSWEKKGHLWLDLYNNL
jgi:glycosyltransferase involved in cell wall biosynthesis